ncbi:hypothetical protein J4G57_05380 [Aeromonas caviae]|uniref:hypothetical protein n=1 Tax=Aeromonas TaxID=642 RepID=UPI001BD55968|nr:MULTISPECIES: hypothetical protein [Aeromonas]MBS4707325.1 hypothetical protein [Aeromonas caviae]MCE9850247.1 hypothetical protein [Aeromonas allosaccharophila]
MELNKEALVQEIINATTEEVAQRIVTVIDNAIAGEQYQVRRLEEELQRARQELEYEETARQQRAERQKQNDMFAKLIKIEN